MAEHSNGLAPGGCIARLRSVYSSLRPSEQQTADYVLAHPEEVTTLSVTELAARSGTSESTVVKLAQRLGYKGYLQMKLVLASEAGAQRREENRIYGEITVEDDLATIKEKLFRSEVQGLTDTLRLLDVESVAAARDAMLKAAHIHFYGVGASGIVAMDAQHKFARIGLPCWAYVDPHQQAAFAAILQPGDVAVGISYSGSTRDTIESLQTARQAGATTVAITAGFGSPLAKEAQICLLTGTTETAFRSAAIVSRLTQLAVVDVLFIAVATRQADTAFATLEKTRVAVLDKKVSTSPRRHRQERA